MKIGMITPVRNENNYLLEFIKHYVQLGVDKIILLDNNDKDGERPEDVIPSFVYSKVVEVINKRGEEYNHTKWAQDTYDYLSNTVDWVCLFDTDEFLEFKKNGETLQSFICKDVFKNYDCIQIPWRTFGDNGLVKVVDKNYKLKERFKTPIPFEKDKWSKRTKSILRASCNFKKVNEHGTGENCRRCDCSGRPTTNSIDITSQIKDPDAVLNHYRTKTIEEFVKRRVADKKYGYRDLYANHIDYFFQVNEKTPEKLEVIDKLLGVV